jgi:hypothetical protein
MSSLWKRAAILAVIWLPMMGCTISSSPGTQTPVSLSILPTNLTLPLGLSQGFLAVVTLHDGTQQDATKATRWTSSQTAVATIDIKGILQTVGTGTTTITATYLNLTAATTVTVTPPAVISVNISPAAPNPVTVGTTIAFTATGTMSDGSTSPDITKKVTWSSSNKAVATVDSAGGSTALAVGVTQIGATYGSGQNAPSAFVTVIVNPVLQKIVVSPDPAAIAVKTTQQFAATAFYGDGSTQDITNQASTTWAITSCTPTGIASLSNRGLAKATANGSCSITAASGAITSNAAVLNVSSPTLTKISVIPATPSAPIGVPVQFQAFGAFSDGTVQELTALSGTVWTSSATTVADNPVAGKTTTKKAGPATITAKFGGLTASTTLTVSSAILSTISVSPGTAQLAEGTTFQLKATGKFSDNSTQDLTNVVTWKSSSPVVGISSSGLATGNNPGSSTVTTTLQVPSGTVSGTATVKISLVGTSLVAITPASATIAPGTPQRFIATATFSDKTKQDISSLVQWGSTDASVATIQDFGASAGLASAVGNGSTSISAVFGSVSASPVTLTVKNVTLTSVAVTAKASMTLGSSQPLKATATFSDSSTQDVTAVVTWKSSDIGVVVVNSGGIAVSAGKGTATVTATLNGTASSPATITVP